MFLLINIKLLTFKHFRKYIFNNVLMNLFTFTFSACCCCCCLHFEHLFVNIVFRDRQKADFEQSSHFVKILLLVCQNCLNQLDVNKQSLIRAHLAYYNDNIFLKHRKRGQVGAAQSRVQVIAIGCQRAFAARTAVT
jgi:hypothetical protein